MQSFERTRTKEELIYVCNRLWLSSGLQHVDNLAVSISQCFQTSNTRDIKYNTVDLSIILCANNHKTGTGIGTGRRTLTLPAPRFFFEITHTDTKFSEMQEGWKES